MPTETPTPTGAPSEEPIYTLGPIAPEAPRHAVCRFTCTLNEPTEGGGRRIKLASRYDPDLPEDQRFCRATPSGAVAFQIDNEALFDFFVPGQSYHLHVLPCD